MEAVDLRSFRCPRWSELPDLDLYMDQVLIVVANALRPLVPNDPNIITATMVNNYVKQGILMPSVKKKYSRDHIATLITITALKRVLSVAEIKLVFSVTNDRGEISRRYDGFCAYLENRLSGAESAGKSGDLMQSAVDALAGKLEFEAKCAALRQ